MTEVATADRLIADGNGRIRSRRSRCGRWRSHLLALIGVYGAFWGAVRQRTREFGVRLALGAEPSGIVRMVLRETVTVALAGLAIGLPIAIASSRVLRGLLFGVEPTDPATFAAASVLLVTAALAASYSPARRAGRVDPTEALRYE